MGNKDLTAGKQGMQRIAEWRKWPKARIHRWPLNTVGVGAPTPHHAVKNPRITFDYYTAIPWSPWGMRSRTPRHRNPQPLKSLIRTVENDAHGNPPLTPRLRAPRGRSKTLFPPTVGWIRGHATRGCRAPTVRLPKTICTSVKPRSSNPCCSRAKLNFEIPQLPHLKC